MSTPKAQFDFLGNLHKKYEAKSNGGVAELAARLDEMERRMNSGEFKGEKGDIGATGDKGDKGVEGSRGDKGIDGSRGPRGEAGSRGTRGPIGE